MANLFIFNSWMLFLAPAMDNADPLIVLEITLCFYLHRVEMVDQDSASGSLLAVSQL